MSHAPHTHTHTTQRNLYLSKGCIAIHLKSFAHLCDTRLGGKIYDIIVYQIFMKQISDKFDFGMVYGRVGETTFKDEKCRKIFNCSLVKQHEHSVCFSINVF